MKSTIPCTIIIHDEELDTHRLDTVALVLDHDVQSRTVLSRAGTASQVVIVVELDAINSAWRMTPSAKQRAGEILRHACRWYENRSSCWPSAARSYLRASRSESMLQIDSWA